MPADAPGPSCVGRTAADLLRHLAEVQHSWAQVVSAGAAGDDVAEPPRPAADLTAGRAGAPPSVELAADGVDELLRVMLDGGRAGAPSRRTASR